MISLLNVNKFIKENKLEGPISSSQIFMGKSKSFHPQGLFSEDIFGLEGSNERRKKMSWIDLNCQVINPVIYDRISKRLDKKIPKLLSGEVHYSLDTNGYLIEDENGELDGFSSFIKNINNIRLRPGESTEEDDLGERNHLLDVIYKSIRNNTFLISKLIVISPDYRPILISEDSSFQQVKMDEINEIYQRVVRLSMQLQGLSGSLYDILSYKLQLLLVMLFEFIKVKVSKKQGMIRNLMLGKRVDFSARSVITPNPNLELGYIGVPFRTCCSLFEPNLIYGLVNSKESQTIPAEFYSAVKEYLGKELNPTDM